MVWRAKDAELLLLCRNSSLNSNGSDSVFVGVGDGGVWRSMFVFAVLAVENGPGR